MPNSDNDLNLNDKRLDTDYGINEESGKNEKNEKRIIIQILIRKKIKR